MLHQPLVLVAHHPIDNRSFQASLFTSQQGLLFQEKTVFRYVIDILASNGLMPPVLRSTIHSYRVQSSSIQACATARSFHSFPLRGAVLFRLQPCLVW